MRESTVERHLRRQVSTVLKGNAYKFTSPGRNNVPDRILCLPGGHLHFVETKAPGKKAKPGQAREHVRLQKLGFSVVVLDTTEKVDRFIEMRRKKCPTE